MHNRKKGNNIEGQPVYAFLIGKNLNKKLTQTIQDVLVTICFI